MDCGPLRAVAQGAAPDVSPWARFPLVVTSLELLSRGEEHRAGRGGRGRLLGPGHHRRGAPPQGREGLRGRRGAGEEQLGPAAAHRHAHAVGPRRVPRAAHAHRRRHRAHGGGLRGSGSRGRRSCRAAVRGLLEGKDASSGGEGAGRALPGRRAAAGASKEREALLAAPGRDVQPVRPAGAQPARGGGRLLRAPAAPPPREAVRRGADARATPPWPRSRDVDRCAARRWRNLLRRLESSPAALGEALRTNKALARAEGGSSCPRAMRSSRAFLEVLRGIWAQRARRPRCWSSPRARDTLESLRTELGREGIEALGYHGDLPLVERDRQVARFRDPDGPKVLHLHRGRRRGPQLPVRAPPGALRPAVEPGDGGAAHRPAGPHRAERTRWRSTSSIRRARSPRTCCAAGGRGGRVRRDGGRPGRGAGRGGGAARGAGAAAARGAGGVRGGAQGEGGGGAGAGEARV